MEIRTGNLLEKEVIEFLQEHLADMQSVSPPESKHALDLAGLQMSEISFWSMWYNAKLIGCGAIKQLHARHGEIKFMRIATSVRKCGFASQLLQYLIDTALCRGYRRLSLETGSMKFFEPARRLYEKFGFTYCKPFNGYQQDPNSVFMFLELPIK